MIQISVTTTMAFDTAEDYHRFANSEQVGLLTGFPKELEAAHKTQQPVVVETHRPHYGTTIKTVVEVSDPAIAEELQAKANAEAEEAFHKEHS